MKNFALFVLLMTMLTVASYLGLDTTSNPNQSQTFASIQVTEMHCDTNS